MLPFSATKRQSRRIRRQLLPMKRHFASRRAPKAFALAAVLAWMAAPPAPAAPTPPLPPAICTNGECPPVISQLKYEGRDAYRLSDGRTEAVIVPSLGRIMRYGLVNGPNLLWNAPKDAVANWGGWKNYGGDKNWLAPQKSWPAWHGTKEVWPPDPALDGQEGTTAEVITGGHLRLTTPLSKTTGMQLTREMYFADDGDFVIEQSARKLQGPPMRASIWSIAQTIPGEALFLPANPNSAYKKNFHWLMPPKDEFTIEPAGPTMLRITPQPKGGGVKLGVDSTVSAIASVRDQTAFVLKTNLPKGDYPDGADGAGFPVEAYVNGDSRLYYLELELLSPLQQYRVGSRWQHTMRWSLHALPSADVTAPETVQAVQALLEDR